MLLYILISWNPKGNDRKIKEFIYIQVFIWYLHPKLIRLRMISRGTFSSARRIEEMERKVVERVNATLRQFEDVLITMRYVHLVVRWHGGFWT